MQYEERVIQLTPALVADESVPGGKRLAFQGIHPRDCCFPPKENWTTQYLPVIDPDTGTIAAQGWGDYGEDVIYRDPMSLPAAVASQAHPIVTPAPERKLKMQALSNCSYCSPCYSTLPGHGLTLFPRRDMPDGYGVTDTLSISIDNGERCDYLSAPGVANMNGSGCDCSDPGWSSSDDRDCENCFYNPGGSWVTNCFGEAGVETWYFAAQWFGGKCGHWAGELGDPCTGYSLVNVWVMNYCKHETSEDGTCIYRVKTVISVCVRDRVVPPFACNSFCQSETCQGTLAGWGCFEQPAYKLCNPRGTYSIAIRNPEDDSARCATTVVIS